jgi:hypothetical protein
VAISRQQLQRAWPHIRAALVLLHIVGIMLLALPWSRSLADRGRWKHPHSQRELESWASFARGVGLEMDNSEVEDLLWGITSTYLKVRDVLVSPFARYSICCGTGQGWRMFATPQRKPGQLTIEIEEDGVFRTIYRSRDSEHDWRRHQFDHNRVRKGIGRIYRPSGGNLYNEFAEWFALRAAEDFPKATRARFRQHVGRSLPPAEMKAGKRPTIEIANERVFDLEELR